MRFLPGHPVAQEHALHHQPQLVVPDAGIHLTDLLHGIHDANHAEQVLLVVLLFLVICLFASAKQVAAVLDGIVGCAAQALYCLAPDFFRMRIPCSSAMSISVLRAKTLSLLYFRSFSSFSICLR